MLSLCLCDEHFYHRSDLHSFLPDSDDKIDMAIHQYYSDIGLPEMVRRVAS